MTALSFSVFDSIVEPIYIIDNNFTLLYANKAVEQCTGWCVNSIVNKKCHEIFGQGLQDNCASICPVNKLLFGEITEPRYFDKSLQTAGGETLYVQVSASPLYDDGEIVGSTVLMKDITRLRQVETLSAKTSGELKKELERRQKLEESLRRSEAMYRAMFEYTGTAMLVIDEDKTILMANHEVEKMTGYAREELENKRTWDEFVHPEDLERMKHYHLERRREGGVAPDHYEFKLINTSGKIIDVYYTIGLIPGTGQSIGSMIDITERKNIERALRESEEKYRQLLDDLEDVFYEVDLKGRYILLNNSVERVTGFNKSDLIGKSYRHGVDEENAQIAFAAFNKVYNTGMPERGFTWEIIRPDGEKRNLEVSISPIKDTAGNITGFRGIARDITDRKRAEERLRYLSLHDSLTGLYNRTYFEEEILRLEKGRQFPVSFISADVDGLKKVNDTMGHKKGDELLIAAARALKNSLRSSDVVARVGGDEFVVILPNTDETAAEAACKRIAGAVEQFNLATPELPLSISLGWATAHTSDNMPNLYKRADDNMYREKARKKNLPCQ
ncbi:PAS domain S-box protein [Desulfotruncus alcoholivorax]|uniref:PAS domain S-box protein n=1 Tax=Desulfotruncus alcoholivorax TaxID=265477 RepID=UPI000413BEEB|nr:PAS domain S-box protein [Desulfotruncus alcoholivorax]